MAEEYTQNDYDKDFTSNERSHEKDYQKHKLALEHALDIRKFEIELYWKRSAYFWAFIAAAFAAYGVIQVSKSPSKPDLSVFISCLGIVFSYGWHCVNRGSKSWQENWENHVDLLEDKITGPLYKVTLKRPPTIQLKELIKEPSFPEIGTWIASKTIDPFPYSVSKINQFISIYVTFLWGFFLYKALPEFSLESEINGEYVIVIGATILVCIMFFKYGRTSDVGEYTHQGSKRKSTIGEPAPPPVRRRFLIWKKKF